MSERRAPRGRPPASPGGGGSNAGVRGALLLGVAVILGIVLLQQFDTDGNPGGNVAAVSNPASQTTVTTRRIGLTTVPPVTVTTAKARAKVDVKVLVANGAGVRGLGAATTNALKTAGYTTLAPTDTTAGNVDKTVVQYADGYEAEAREVATALSLPATVVARLASPPVAAADLADAKVVVVLGVDVTTSTTAPATATTAATVPATTSTTRRP